MTNYKIETFEVVAPVYCPFCDKLICSDNDEDDCSTEEYRCEHTLFIACDYGFIYRSDRFNEHFNIEPPEKHRSDEFHPNGMCIDEFTSTVTIPGSIKYAIYEGIGGALGTYFGFAPQEENFK